ncbi:VOC family protein [Arthrobacter sp. CAN_A6]
MGATPAEHQPTPGQWRVLLDPAGHPFCLTAVRPD